MNYLSVCSGIEAASAAWKPLGWSPAWFSEIDPFPSAVLAERHPETPNLGDMTKFHEWPDATIDLLVGGTPCQSFSVAGLRKGLDDPRGSLMLTYLAIARRYRPAWVVWENVPGVLSIDKGRAFGTFLGGLAEIGYGFAYRVLDAQFFGVPQRRRRVFVVGYLGDWRRAAAVLFERQSLSGDSPPSRKAGEEIAPTISARTKGGGGLGTDFDCDGGLITHSLRADGFDAGEDGTGRGTPLIIEQNNMASLPDLPSLRAHETPNYAVALPLGTRVDRGGSNREAQGNNLIPVAFAQNTRDEVREMQIAGALGAETGTKQQTYLRSGMAVRRLTPRECERLQGFQDDYTLITYRKKPAADGPRYKALGNSMAVPVMRWIGERIQTMAILTQEAGEE